MAAMDARPVGCYRTCPDGFQAVPFDGGVSQPIEFIGLYMPIMRINPYGYGTGIYIYYIYIYIYMYNIYIYILYILYIYIYTYTYTMYIYIHMPVIFGLPI